MKKKTRNYFEIYECFTDVIKRAVRTAPEPEAMTCWYGLIVAAEESEVISEEEYRDRRKQKNDNL